MPRNTASVRRGSVLPMVTIMLVMIVAFLALAIDIGLMTLARSHAQHAADLGAMAGARYLSGQDDYVNPDGNTDPYGEVYAKKAAEDQALLNKVISQTPTSAEAKVGYYTFNTTNNTFEHKHKADFTPAAGETPSAVQVTVASNQRTFFAPVIGFSSYAASAKATSVHRPRDVAIILDFSGSMRFESVNGLSGSSYASGGNSITSSMNPDSGIPDFGHWDEYQGVPGRLRRIAGVGSSPYYFPPSNWTQDSSDSGPAMVKDYYYDSSWDPNQSDANAAVTAGNLKRAFHNESFDPIDPSDGTSAYPNQTGGWNANEVIGTPAPATAAWRNQSDPAYVGDVWPRRNASPSPATASLGGNTYARHVRDFLEGNNSAYANDHVKDVGITNNYPGADPASFENSGYDIGGRTFVGYSMGPGYYGKTFFMWPPDPRPQWDWRKRFFYYPGSPGNRMDDNSLLFDMSSNAASPPRYLRTPGGGTYEIDYPAILAWIKQGPRTLPPNLRAGRVLFYKHIPSDVDTGTGSVDEVADKLFWKNYIDYVIGNWDEARDCLYGCTNQAFNGADSSVVRITAKANLTGDPKPYLHYNDCPRSPLGHFWFGPLSMMDFIQIYNRSWTPGTTHEAQSWQMKAGVNSALTDIEKNHPNDWVTTIYYSALNAYNVPRVTLGKDYPRMKNALFFPFGRLDNLGDPNDPTTHTDEWRPYNPATFANRAAGQIPHADGATSPEMGLYVAFNQFSTSNNGRRGATKFVILETDGVPNTICNRDPVSGDLTPGSQGLLLTGLSAGGSSGADTRAIAAAERLCAQDDAADQEIRGYSRGSSLARIHCLAFGDLFDPSASGGTLSPDAITALTFLYNVEVKGNTSKAGEPVSPTMIPAFKVITGVYDDRIDKLRSALERIMQSGVQVTLIKGSGEYEVP